jgi:hypothetical protein
MTSGQDLLENHRAGDCEANSRVFCQDSKNKSQDIVEASATPEMQKETTNNNARAINVG